MRLDCNSATFGFLICLGVLLSGSAFSGDSTPIQSASFTKFLDSAPPLFKNMFHPRHSPPNYKARPAGQYRLDDWQTAIDSTWGNGLSLDNRKMFFQSTWDLIDQNFPAFNGLDPNVWQNVWDLYWPEIENPSISISKGRFCAIMQHSTMVLGDDHTSIMDLDVSFTEPLPGVPLFICASIGVNDHFGAGLTPLSDSTLLVYRAIDPHPMGLVPGDIILGYQGIPWKEIYPQLLEAHLPMDQPPYHTTSETFAHSILSAAGLNWHLFDTIDIVKYQTGDTLHLPTELLAGENMELWATEQLDIEGVPKPNPYFEELFSWGYIEGTNIAYIYTHGWWGNESELLGKWEAALDSIMYNSETSGLIIDDRANWGTAFLTFLNPMNRLFDDTLQTYRWYNRCSSEDHFDMCRYHDLDIFINSIDGESYHFFNQPIAILTGPHAVSGGDLFPLSMTFHPMVKIFGKPTCGAFSTVTAGEWIYPNWFISLTFTVCDLADNPGDYILRKIFPNPLDFPWVEYEEVWLTPEGVAQGRDDVVESAVTWILGGDVDQDGIDNSQDNCPGTLNPLQLDADGDGVGDSCDVCIGNDNYADLDLDSTPFCYDNCPSVFNPGQINSDNDGYGDDCDNCPDHDNQDQSDADGDTIGDVCDECTDTDGDGWGDPGYAANTCGTDNCPDHFNPMQTDTDEDGIGDACEYFCGDANSDETANIGDAVYLISYIFKGGPAPDPLEAGDANCDGNVNVGDAVYLIAYVFKGGPEPCCP
jgi:hypothetical protein